MILDCFPFLSLPLLYPQLLRYFLAQRQWPINVFLLQSVLTALFCGPKLIEKTAQTTLRDDRVIDPDGNYLDRPGSAWNDTVARCGLDTGIRCAW